MKVIGITGGVGVGKSTVLSYLETEYQAVIIQADQVAKELILPDAPLYEAYIEIFGEDVVLEDRTLNRQRIAERLFAFPDLVKEINHLVHPMVAKEISHRIQENAHMPYVVVEAALLKEGKLDKICDSLWFIFSEKETRINRLMASRGYTREKCLEMISNQSTDKEFAAYCHHTIDNSGDFARTAEQINTIMRTL